jgi:hypothetical protein
MSWLWHALAKFGSIAEYYLTFWRSQDAWCIKCGAAINERWDRVAGSRVRCPSLRCRNNTRALNAKATMAGSGGLEVYDMLRWGNRRLYGVWGQDGWAFFRLGQSWQMVRRTFDKLSDRYSEEIRDRTGRIIKTVEEPLSKHRGHGSAKRDDRQ